jgi:hypothetical protein
MARRPAERRSDSVSLASYDERSAEHFALELDRLSTMPMRNQREAEHIIFSILKHVLLMGWCARI